MAPRRDEDTMAVDSDSDMSFLDDDEIYQDRRKGKGKAAADKRQKNKGKNKAPVMDAVRLLETNMLK